MKTSGSDQIFNRRNLFVLAVATVVFFAVMIASVDHYLRVVGACLAGFACFVWWAALVWQVGNRLRSHRRLVWLYDIVTSAMPALFVWAFLYDRYKDVTIDQGSLWASFLLGMVAGSIVGTVGAVGKRALNSHDSPPPPPAGQNDKGE